MNGIGSLIFKWLMALCSVAGIAWLTYYYGADLLQIVLAAF